MSTSVLRRVIALGVVLSGVGASPVAAQDSRDLEAAVIKKIREAQPAYPAPMWRMRLKKATMSPPSISPTPKPAVQYFFETDPEMLTGCDLELPSKSITKSASRTESLELSELQHFGGSVDVSVGGNIAGVDASVAASVEYFMEKGTTKGWSKTSETSETWNMPTIPAGRAKIVYYQRAYLVYAGTPVSMNVSVSEFEVSQMIGPTANVWITRTLDKPVVVRVTGKFSGRLPEALATTSVEAQTLQGWAMKDPTPEQYAAFCGTTSSAQGVAASAAARRPNPRATLGLKKGDLIPAAWQPPRR